MKVHHTALGTFLSYSNGHGVCALLKALVPAIGLLVLPAVARAEEPDVAPPDIFIGMIVTDGANLVLERCDLARTRYRLQPAADADDPLGELRGKTGKVQAQVIARNRADGDAHVLEVSSVEGIQPGKTCHLLDAVEAHLSASAVAPLPQADGDRWDALAAGSAAPAGGELIGSGAYAYRFVLLHPRTGRPAAHTDYALSASRATDYELPFVTDEKKVFQGRTDAEGRTPVFLLPVRLPDAAFDLRERFGRGPYGETFHLTDHNDNDLFNMPYALITCTSPPRFFRGYTYPNGDTAYTASDGPINVQLRVLDDIDEALPASCEDGRSEDGDHVVLPTTREKDTE
jgi:hypothetical protein